MERDDLIQKIKDSSWFCGDRSDAEDCADLIIKNSYKKQDIETKTCIEKLHEISGYLFKKAKDHAHINRHQSEVFMDRHMTCQVAADLCPKMEPKMNSTKPELENPFYDNYVFSRKDLDRARLKWADWLEMWWRTTYVQCSDGCVVFFKRSSDGRYWITRIENYVGGDVWNTRSGGKNK